MGGKKDCYNMKCATLQHDIAEQKQMIYHRILVQPVEKVENFLHWFLK